MLKEYLEKGHSPYHVVELTAGKLQTAGFRQISLSDVKEPAEGDYFLKIGDTALFAFRIPAEPAGELRIAAAHADYPCFKVKPSAEMASCGNCRRINIEPYGGMIKRSWFDRPLGVAGAVWIKGEDSLNPVMKLIDTNRPVCMIPSIAPHMDREVDGRSVDYQKEMIPMTGLAEGMSFLELISREAECSEEDILSYDLNLYVFEGCFRAGADGEFIMGQGIDNLASAAALTEAFAEGKGADDRISMICLFDNEEIGSRTRQGADSLTLSRLLDRLGTDIDNEKSFIISADGAHGVHPNYPEKSDSTSLAELGKGIVVKTSASRRYATEGRMTAIIKGICGEENIPCQIQANRSGAPGGSTVGPMLSSLVPMAAADVGIPMLAMHSTCECAALSDYECLKAFIKAVL